MKHIDLLKENYFIVINAGKIIAKTNTRILAEMLKENLLIIGYRNIIIEYTIVK